MDDLISRAAAIAEIEEYLQGLKSCIEPDLKLDWYRNGLRFAIYELNELPAVDAVPVVHGHWIVFPDVCVCSECNEDSPSIFEYCPNCGATMDKEAKEGWE